jgi:hypothetical protein
LPRSHGRRTLEFIDDAAIILPDAHQLLPTFTRWHSVVPTVARDSLEVSVERVEVQVDGLSHDDGFKTQGHYHTCLCLSEFAPSTTR